MPPPDDLDPEEDALGEESVEPFATNWDSVAVILEQARLFWSAEETNATRLANRGRLIVTIQVALLFGVILKLPEFGDGATLLFMSISILLLVLSILAGLRFKFTPIKWLASLAGWHDDLVSKASGGEKEEEAESDKPFHPTASRGLSWPEGFGPSNEFWEGIESRREIVGSFSWLFIQQAAAALSKMNGLKQASLDRAQSLLGCALLALTVALACYIGKGAH
jgi:hypothetical protein